MKSRYSLFRQTDNVDDIFVSGTEPVVGDQIGLCFPPLMMLGPANITLIEPEWVEDYAISSTSGNTSAVTGFHYAIFDVTEFDYVLLPISKDSSTATCTGLCHGPGTSLTARISSTIPAGYDALVSAYAIFKVDADNNLDYAGVTTRNDAYYPILGFKIPS